MVHLRKNPNPFMLSYVCFFKPHSLDSTLVKNLLRRIIDGKNQGIKIKKLKLFSYICALKNTITNNLKNENKTKFLIDFNGVNDDLVHGFV